MSTTCIVNAPWDLDTIPAFPSCDSLGFDLFQGSNMNIPSVSQPQQNLKYRQNQNHQNRSEEVQQHQPDSEPEPTDVPLHRSISNLSLYDNMNLNFMKRFPSLDFMQPLPQTQTAPQLQPPTVEGRFLPSFQYQQDLTVKNNMNNRDVNMLNMKTPVKMYGQPVKREVQSETCMGVGATQVTVPIVTPMPTTNRSTSHRSLKSFYSNESTDSSNSTFSSGTYTLLNSYNDEHASENDFELDTENALGGYNFDFLDDFMNIFDSNQVPTLQNTNVPLVRPQLQPSQKLSNDLITPKTTVPKRKRVEGTSALPMLSTNPASASVTDKDTSLTNPKPKRRRRTRAKGKGRGPTDFTEDDLKTLAKEDGIERVKTKKGVRKRRRNEWTSEEVVLLLTCTRLLIDYELKTISQALFLLIKRDPGKCWGRAAEKKLKRMQIFENWKTCDKPDVVKRIEEQVAKYAPLPADLQEEMITVTNKIKDEADRLMAEMELQNMDDIEADTQPVPLE